MSPILLTSGPVGIGGEPIVNGLFTALGSQVKENAGLRGRHLPQTPGKTRSGREKVQPEDIGHHVRAMHSQEASLDEVFAKVYNNETIGNLAHDLMQGPVRVWEDQMIYKPPFEEQAPEVPDPRKQRI